MASGCVCRMTPLPVLGSHGWGGRGPVGGLASRVNPRDLRAQPGSSPQHAHAGCLRAPGPPVPQGAGSWLQPASRFLPFYRSAHTPPLCLLEFIKIS